MLGVLTSLAIALAAPPLWQWWRRTPVRERAAREAPEGSFADIAPARTHYQLGGPVDGPRVVLIHGFSTPSQVWDGQWQALIDVGCRVLRYDLCGRGLSDRPHGRHDAALYRRQLIALLDALDWRDAVDVIGYSMGGAVAVDVCAAEPARVRRLVVLAAAGYDTGARRRDVALLRIPVIGDWCMATLGEPIQRQSVRKPHNSGVALPELPALIDAELRTRGYLQTQLSTLRHYPLDALQQAYRTVADQRTPMLAIWGGADPVIPLSHLDLLRADNPAARTLVVEDAAHALPYSHPEAVNAALLDFLTEDRSDDETPV